MESQTNPSPIHDAKKNVNESPEKTAQTKDENAKSRAAGYKDRRQGYLILALVILFIAGAFLASRYLASMQTTPPPERETAERALPVQTAEVRPGDYRLRFSTTGTVQARALTDIVPQVSGKVVSVDESAFSGGRITPETLLFAIEKEDYRLAVERMRAEVARAETQLRLRRADTRASVEEWRELGFDTPIPPLVAKRPQLDEAKAVLRSAKAQLETARLNLSRTEFRLPFTGRVTEFRMEEGQYVVAGQSYGRAYRVASLEIDLPLESRRLAWLLEADEPEITVTAGYLGEKEYTAYVKRIAGTVDQRTRLSSAVLGLDATDPELVPGVFVNVTVIGPERADVWRFPLKAMQENGGVWAVTPEKTLRLLRAEMLQITDRHAVAKSDGNAVTVVLGNLPEGTEGAKVRPVASGESNGGMSGQSGSSPEVQASSGGEATPSSQHHSPSPKNDHGK